MLRGVVLGLGPLDSHEKKRDSYKVGPYDGYKWSSGAPLNGLINGCPWGYINPS